MMKMIKGLGILLAVLVLLIVLSIVSAKNTPPPQIVANFTNLERIEKNLFVTSVQIEKLK